MRYFVAPEGPTEWRMPRQVFAEALRRRWPGARIDTSPESSPAAFYTVPTGEGGGLLDGTLHDNEQTFAFEDELPHAAELAIWLRSLAPESEPLIFFTDQGTCTVTLTRATTKRAQPSGPLSKLILEIASSEAG